jgi:hypothetical protein
LVKIGKKPILPWHTCIRFSLSFILLLLYKLVALNSIVLVTPPFTQLNTPYPATAYLKGFLNTKQIESYQYDLGIETLLVLFSKAGLTQLFEQAAQQSNPSNWTENDCRIFGLQTNYIQTIDSVIAFLQGKSPSLAKQICSGYFLPEASRFAQVDETEWAFGTLGMQDKAKHLATLYLEDLSDFIVSVVDENFGFSRYAERLGRSASSFDELYVKLHQEQTFIDQLSLRLFASKICEIQPRLLCLSVPFPGNLYSAFRCAQWVKQHYPSCKVAMGGGFPNTELRAVSDPRVFEFLDFITLDDGELPLELLWQHLEQPELPRILKRTFLLDDGQVIYVNNTTQSDYKQAQVGTPDYTNLPLTKYISVIEVLNPMHSLWSDGRWNKLTMAHGCYWGKCTFCDISLDYISLYEPVAAALLVDRMDELIAATGETGFHFVDEAAPPALMREVALEIIRRNLVVSWWTNIRFEKSFTADLCLLLKKSGCIAVSGGLEVASDRLLALIDKGVSVAQVAQVTRNFTETGILVHAYLMYGYPTQTIQETVDSLEMVRQLFEMGVVQSGFWHQFALTAHSPIGLNPEKYGITILNPAPGTFANNDLLFTDATGIDHDQFSFGLKKSLYNYMHGICFELPLQDWFDFKIPKTSVSPYFIEQAIDAQLDFIPKPSSRIVWLGNLPELSLQTKSKRGQQWAVAQLQFHDLKDSFSIQLPEAEGVWLQKMLSQCQINQSQKIKLADMQDSFEQEFENFELFWQSKPLKTLRSFGLVCL